MIEVVNFIYGSLAAKKKAELNIIPLETSSIIELSHINRAI
jgi:hypothetical protein